MNTPHYSYSCYSPLKDTVLSDGKPPTSAFTVLARLCGPNARSGNGNKESSTYSWNLVICLTCTLFAKFKCLEGMQHVVFSMLFRSFVWLDRMSSPDLPHTKSVLPSGPNWRIAHRFSAETSAIHLRHDSFGSFGEFPPLVTVLSHPIASCPPVWIVVL